MTTVVYWTDGFGNNHADFPIARFIDEGTEFCVVKRPGERFEIIKIFERKINTVESLYGNPLL